MVLFCTCDFFHNVKFMANKHKSFFLLTEGFCSFFLLVSPVLIWKKEKKDDSAKCLEVFKAAYHACAVLFCGGLNMSYLCLWLLSSLHKNRQSSQILSLSLSSHLGNSNLFLQSVGAGGQHEILKSTSLCSPLPTTRLLSWPAPPSPFLYPPLNTDHQWNGLQSSDEVLLGLTFPGL